MCPKRNASSDAPNLRLVDNILRQAVHLCHNGMGTYKSTDNTLLPGTHTHIRTTSTSIPRPTSTPICIHTLLKIFSGNTDRPARIPLRRAAAALSRVFCTRPPPPRPRPRLRSQHPCRFAGSLVLVVTKPIAHNKAADATTMQKLKVKMEVKVRKVYFQLIVRLIRSVRAG